METNPDLPDPSTAVADVAAHTDKPDATEPIVNSSENPALKRQKVDEEEEKEIVNDSFKLPAYLANIGEKRVPTDRFKKRKIAIIAGYNGSKYQGSQIQKMEDILTVENDLIKALYLQGMIAERNVVDLKKIKFTRATRTDKRVHALQNCFAGKFLIDQDKTLEQLCDDLNECIDKDVRVFSLLNVVGGFDSKHAASFREYDYYLPTFMLSPDVNINYTVPEEQPEQNKDPNNYRSLKRFKVTLDISELEKVYNYRLTDDRKELLERLLLKFEGTHKFHNYTKEMKSKDKNSQRYMMSIKVKEYKVYDGIEFARVFLVGQSFLYNQIRKMMGSVFMVMHYGLPEAFIDNSLKDNDTNIPTAPGEGLMLNRVAFDRYNYHKKELKDPIEPWDHKLEEIEKFRVELVNFICATEKNTHAFTQWLAWMHESKSNFI